MTFIRPHFQISNQASSVQMETGTNDMVRTSQKQACGVCTVAALFKKINIVSAGPEKACDYVN